MDKEKYTVRLPHPIFKTEFEYPQGMRTQKGAFDSSHDTVIVIYDPGTQRVIAPGRVFIAEDGHGYLLVSEEDAEHEPFLLDENWFVYAYATDLKSHSENPIVIEEGVIRAGYLAPYPAMWKDQP